MNVPLAGTGTPLMGVRPVPPPVLSSPPLAAEPPPEDLIDFSALSATLWRGRWRIAAAGLLGALAVGVWAATLATPQYRATVTLVMATSDTAAPIGLDSVVPGLGGSSVEANTEVEILRSRTLLTRVAEELLLYDDPRLNPTLAPPGPVTARWRTLAAALGLPAGWYAAPPPRAATIDALAQRFAVRNMPDSRVFEVTAHSPDPAHAAELANTLARLYLADQVALKQAKAARAADWLGVQVADLQTELEEAESRARAFAAEMELVDATALQGLSAQLADIRDRIGARRADLATRGITGTRADDQMRAMLDMETALSARLRQQSQDLVTLGQLQLEAAASREIYEHFLARLKEASVQRGIQTPDSRILAAAEQPSTPARPQPLLLALLAGVLAAAAAATRRLLAEARADTFRAPQALESATGLPVLGQIPQVAARPGLAALAVARPASFAAESLRQLRTALQFSGPGLPQVIVVTSSVPDEGKSTLSRALAQNIAALGKSVLLVQADIRRAPLPRAWTSRLSHWLPLRRGGQPPGLLAVLEGRCGFAAAIRQDAPGLCVLPADSTASNAADLLASPRFDRLVGLLRGRFDCIVIDTPPVLAVPDARLIGRTADSILFAVAWDRTTREDLRAGLHALHTVRLAPGGLVLTRIDRRALARYGSASGFGSYAAHGYYEA